MSFLPKRMDMKRSEIERIKNVEDAKKWLRQFVDVMDETYTKIIAQLRILKTDTFKIYEDKDGDLVFKKWDGTEWKDAHTISGS